jgi:hypothetical protein
MPPQSPSLEASSSFPPKMFVDDFRQLIVRPPTLCIWRVDDNGLKSIDVPRGIALSTWLLHGLHVAHARNVERLVFLRLLDVISVFSDWPLTQQMLHRPRLEKRNCLSPSHTSEDDRWLTRPTFKDDDNEDYSPLHRGR